MKRIRYFLPLVLLFAVSTAQAATLTLSPSTKSIAVGDTFSVDIMLNTQGSSIDGVDVQTLNYNPSLLQVQGTQLTAGTLMPNTLANAIDAAAGQITFSQTTNGGTTYNGSGVLATVVFKALAAGNAAVSFSYTNASTTETNVASAGNDVLTSVTNGAYTVTAVPTDTTAPVISTIANSGLTTTAVTITWTTNENSDSQVDYGLTTAYGQSSALIDTGSSMKTSHSISLSGLSAGTTYHYRVKSKDAAGNGASSGDLTFVTTAAPDTTAPSPVTDLSPQNITQTSVDLVTWTAPGDDGNVGTAYAYDLRFATTPINDSNFSAATAAVGLPTPLPAGTRQTYVLVGLQPGTTYYAALKTRDEVSNWSDISNIATFTTLSPVTSSPDTTPPPQVASVVATGLDGQVVLSWKNPVTSPDYVRSVVVRKEGSTAPLTIADGTVIYEGTSESFVDTGLANGVVYSYSIFTLDRVPNYSLPMMATATPSSGATQTTTNPDTMQEPVPQTKVPKLKLINSKGTYYLIIDGVRHGITLPGILFSYGFALNQAKEATEQDMALPEGDILLPGDGVLAKSPQDKTVWLISNNQRHGFTSEAVFKELGFTFKQVLVVTAPELNRQSIGENISNGKSAHLPGIDIQDGSMVYWIDYGYIRHPYSTLNSYNSWHVPNDFSRVLPANAADKSLPVGESVVPRHLD